MLFEIIAALYAGFNIAAGSTKKECQKGSPERNWNCDNIYIWRAERKEFVSLSNSTLIDTPGSHPPVPEGEIVRVIAGNMLPYITSSNASDELGGYVGEIWSITQTALKFKNQISSVEYEDGERTMEEGLGDVMLAATVAFKSNNIEFTQPIFFNWYHLYMKKPKARASSAPYLRSFDMSLRLASISFPVVLMCLLYTTCRIMRAYKAEERNISLSTCLLAVLCGFLNQGYDPQIKSVSGRLLLFVTLIFGLLIYSSMNAVLVSQLAVSELELPFKNLEEVAAIGTHSVCIRRNAYIYKNFTDANKTLLPIWKGIVNSGGCLNIENQDNIAKVICKNNIVILENRVVISNVERRSQLNCELMLFYTKLFPRANPLMVSKKFKYKKQIDITLMKIKSYGILQRIEKKWMGEQFAKNQDQVISQVTLQHIDGILMLLGLMTAVSLIILAVEMIVHKQQGSRKVTVPMKTNFVGRA